MPHAAAAKPNTLASTGSGPDVAPAGLLGMTQALRDNAGVSVSCPGCGRDYAKDRVRAGRTFRCTCGARVVGPLMSVARPPGPPRFLADTMMGGLARWLRILGFDAVHDAALNDDALVRRALAEGRSILTRDRRLGQEWRIDAVVCFTSDAPLKQLAELARAVDLDRDARPFTRCSVCNAELVEARAEDVRERVPENVLRTSTSFVQCPSCLRVYWEGSHTARMRRMLARVLPSAAARQ